MGEMELITTQQAAKILGLSARRVRELAGDGSLPAVAVGRDWLFEPAAVARFKATPRRGRGRPRKTNDGGAE
jgi:excisionase family DNA binding protein